jgi:large conductance mechanosensitive channel
MACPEANSTRSFISQVISFAMLGLSLYGLAHLYQLASTEPIIKHTKKCKYCRQRINEKVRVPFFEVSS